MNKAIDEALFRRPILGETVARLPTGLVPARQILSGRHVRLEPLDPARHGTELYRAAHGDPAVTQIWDFLAYGPWSDQGEFTGWLRECAATLDPIFYAIRRAENGFAEGMASYLDIQPKNGVIEIGHIWFGTGLQRSRAATEALYLLLDYAMTDLGYRRMQWRCNALNSRSRAAARRLGFRFEGIFHNHMIVKGRNRDTAWYSLLDGDWPSVRDALQTWLADDNFTADGLARRSLTAMTAI